MPNSEEDIPYPEEVFGLIVEDGRCIFWEGSPLGSRLHILKALSTLKFAKKESDPDLAIAA